jgi:hypothetical protein
MTKRDQEENLNQLKSLGMSCKRLYPEDCAFISRIPRSLLCKFKLSRTVGKLLISGMLAGMNLTAYWRCASAILITVLVFD